MPNNAAYFAFLADPNQEARRAELRDFCGPNADTFLRAYDKLREDTPQVSGGRPKFRLFGGGFEVAAFFLGPVWFFYRKMWMFAWVITGLIVVLMFVPFRQVGFILSLILAGLAHRSYVQYAVTRLTKLHAANAVVTPAMVQAEGGVSKPAGIISGIIFGLIYVLGIVSIIYAVTHGVDPNSLR
ncbi:DUF2628 domain-containing protein [Terriglobus sp.]|uniref:DUF2628 domain-containing protein n=1 Tax=Terriglobus sp. TaxID=1889013 RepID=UPI003B00D535